MKRVWHPYTAWECYKHGMWRIVGVTECADLAALFKNREFSLAQEAAS